MCKRGLDGEGLALDRLDAAPLLVDLLEIAGHLHLKRCGVHAPGLADLELVDGEFAEDVPFQSVARGESRGVGGLHAFEHLGFGVRDGEHARKETVLE